MFVEQSSSKQKIIEELLEQGMVLVTLDATHAETVLPPTLQGDAQLRLNLSYRFGLPMTIDDKGVLATLTFGGVPFDCFLPWSCIYMYISHVSGDPYLFPADIPEKAAASIMAPSESPKPKPKLRVVSSEPEPSPTEKGKELSAEIGAEQGKEPSIEPNIEPALQGQELQDQQTSAESQSPSLSPLSSETSSPDPSLKPLKKERTRPHLRVVK